MTNLPATAPPHHFAIFCFPSTGHLNTFIPLGRELQRRGHRVTVVGILDIQAPVKAAGLAFVAMGTQTFPEGSTHAIWTRLGQLKGLAAVQYTSQIATALTALCLAEAPMLLKEAVVTACLVDQVTPGGGSVAEALGLPFISLCSALPLNWHVTIPPCFTDWRYGCHPWAQARNFLGYLWLYHLTRPLRHQIAAFRQTQGLPPHEDPNDAYSPLLQLSQQPSAFEYPRSDLPLCFHFTGPYHSPAGRAAVPFPFERLGGDRPLIYASLGTLQNRLPQVFECIARACQPLGVQLVIALGRPVFSEDLPVFPGNPVVVGYAPQLALIQRAALVITHGGLNTALECLTYGVPMVAIPITNDQKGVAARIVWSGVGEKVALHHLRAGRLQRAVQRVLADPRYRHNAGRLQTALREAGGVTKAADLIEQAVYAGSVSSRG